MTIKEIADFTGKNKSTIGRWVAKCNSRVITEKNVIAYRRGDSIDYSIDEVEEILNAGSMSKDAVRILMENARKPIASLEVKTEPNQMDVLFAFMEHQQQVNQDFMKTVLSELKTMKQPLQIEQPKQDYYSLVAYCSIEKIPTVQSELRKMGMDLRKMTIDSKKDLHKVKDERWGFVNSYPVEVLNEYFSE